MYRRVANIATSCGARNRTPRLLLASLGVARDFGPTQNVGPQLELNPVRVNKKAKPTPK